MSWSYTTLVPDPVQYGLYKLPITLETRWRALYYKLASYWSTSMLGQHTELSHLRARPFPQFTRSAVCSRRLSYCPASQYCLHVSVRCCVHSHRLFTCIYRVLCFPHGFFFMFPTIVFLFSLAPFSSNLLHRYLSSFLTWYSTWVPVFQCSRSWSRVL